MKFSNLFAKSKIDIIPVKNFDNGIVFYVKNGKGLLRVKYGSSEGKGLCAVVFDGTPLMKFHGDEYLCPTCEKLISAGYGLNMCDNKELEKLGDIFNAQFVSLEKSFNDLKPLFGLLPTGYYKFSDEELFPTDGQGNFFWNITNASVLNRATCPVHDPRSFEWSSPVPRYILPTQSPKLFNRNRAEYYRTKGYTRAIAYHIDNSYLCVLLDGHHKATAAALNGKPLKTLVISGAWGLSIPNKADNTKAKIFFRDSMVINEDELIESLEKTRKIWGAGNRMSNEETAQFMSMKNDDFEYVWPNEILKTASKYYDVYSVACMEWAGDLSELRLDEILSGKNQQDESLINHIAQALYITGNPRFVDFAIIFCKDERYVNIWHDIFKLLANAKNPKVEEFFIDYLVNDEKIRPDITKIVDSYFAETNNASDTAFQINIKNLYWINGVVDDPDDLCLHGIASARIGDETFEYDGALSATGLYLLRTLTENHIINESEPMLPCCSHFMIPNDDLSSVEVSGCPNGVDWSVVHEADRVKLVTGTSKEVFVDISDYIKEVYAFADEIEDFYNKCSPKNLAVLDEFARNGYTAFWNEWHRRRNKASQILS